jgi:hypothetical protein
MISIYYFLLNTYTNNFIFISQIREDFKMKSITWFTFFSNPLPFIKKINTLIK